MGVASDVTADPAGESRYFRRRCEEVGAFAALEPLTFFRARSHDCWIHGSLSSGDENAGQGGVVTNASRRPANGPPPLLGVLGL